MKVDKYYIKTSPYYTTYTFRLLMTVIDGVRNVDVSRHFLVV